MKSGITIQWTETARRALVSLPPKVREGLLKKADELKDSGDPRNCCKALTGPLQGCYRIVYSRYRAVFTVEEERRSGEQVVLRLRVIFIAAGIRREFDRRDVYRLALRFVQHVLPGLPTETDEPESRGRA